MEWSQRYKIIKEIAAKKIPGYGGGFSYPQFENLLGVTRGKGRGWEERPPKFEDLQKIAEVLDINCQWLLLGIGEPQGEPHPPAETTVPESVQFMREARMLIKESGGSDADVLEMVRRLTGAPPASAKPHVIEPTQNDGDYPVSRADLNKIVAALGNIPESQYTATINRMLNEIEEVAKEEGASAPVEKS